VLPFVAGLVILSAILTPRVITGRAGDPRLSSDNTEPQGARLFFETLGRLGWHPEQQEVADLRPDPGVVRAVLNPPVPLQMSETHALLDHVRAGGALLVALGHGTNTLEDSLHVRAGADGLVLTSGDLGGDGSTDSCARSDRRTLSIWDGTLALDRSLWPAGRAYLSVLQWRAPAPAGLVTFATVNAGLERARPSTVGFPFGAGRIVIVSDPDFLANDALRVCAFDFDARAVRAMEFLRDGGAVPRQRVLFDEYHQGSGAQSGTLRAVAGYLVGTSSGRFFFQLLAAGLALLLAVAPRAVPPRDPERIERRSPLEHVDALARAYAQVGATRTGAVRLLRGLRRRVERGGVRVRTAETDERFLAWIDEMHPALSDDVQLLRQALGTPLNRHEFALLGPAVRRVETTLTRI
jgi:hypothetical protein